MSPFPDFVRLILTKSLKMIGKHLPVRCCSMDEKDGKEKWASGTCGRPAGAQKTNAVTRCLLLMISIEIKENVVMVVVRVQVAS